MNWHPARDGQKTIIVKKERRLILQYHLSSTGLGNFSSGNVIDSEARFAFPFLHSITIISSVILGLFIYQATITKTLRTRCLNAIVQSSPVMAPACRGIADCHTPDYPCVPVLRTSNIPFLLIAKMAYTQHLDSGRARKRGRKGRKLPGEVLQRFKNLSSHSAELSGMNNRFGTWPACTRESVTAALWSRLPAFDGCAVSQNSWRRGAPAAPEMEGEKTTNKKQKQRFLCEADTWFWALPEPDVSPVVWPVVPCTERSKCCCPSTRAQSSAREKVQHNPMGKSSTTSLPGGSPSPAAPHDILPVETTSMGPSSGTTSVDEWVGGTISPSLCDPLSTSKPVLHPQVWLNGNSSLYPEMLMSVFGGFVVGKTDLHA